MTTLFIDKIEKFDLGGSTKDHRKVEYILAIHGLTFQNVLDRTPKHILIPNGMLASGRYVLLFTISWDLKIVSASFINHLTDLDKYFDYFADAMSPKTVAGFHTVREQIKLKHKSELDKVELSDDDLDFETAYRIYLQHNNRQ